MLKCKACRTSWRSNMYALDEIERLYTSEDYAQNPYFLQTVRATDPPYQKRLRNYQRALAFVEARIGVGRLLDVGCGSGAALAIARRRGWEGHGVEMSPILSKLCERHVNASVTTSRFEDASLPERYYDFITFWDVIEHVLDPVFCIEKSRRLLRPGGIALFCTPDESSLLARIGWAVYWLSGSLYRYPALALHPPAHTYFFSRQCFLPLLERQGMSIEACYSQEAFFEQSPLANRIQKSAIAVIERLGALFDRCYEIIVFARS